VSIKFGSGRQLLGLVADPIISAQNLRVLTNVTLCACRRGGPAVTRAQAITASGAAVDIRASVFVLAAGASRTRGSCCCRCPTVCEILRSVENWIGRCFMEHPRDTSLLLKPRSPVLLSGAAFYDVGRSVDGCTTCGHWDWQTADLQVGSANFSVTLLPRERPVGVGAQNPATHGTRHARGGYGWSAMPDPSRYFDAFRLLMNLEATARSREPDHAIAERDALGVPRARLHWSWGAHARTTLDTVRSIVISELESAALGR